MGKQEAKKKTNTMQIPRLLVLIASVGTSKTGARGVVVNRFARHIQSQPALFAVSTVLDGSKSRTRLTIVPPMIAIRALIIVRAILRGEEKYRPQLRCNQ